MMHVSGIPFFLDAFDHLDTNVFYLIVHVHSNSTLPVIKSYV